ncbi:MAG: glycosyltransferase family 4 protein [Thermomonas sp.]|uniref:glycosyltransferase family 4 protein n=1 Tax=Thermomonas sp. TaxID=1971895 RepID=UPI001EC420FD|nr:glycosyltransferase family 4 protein [Thermomonas sp.]MBV2209758.1 glycosyltransferase family 4 protein [Thermomonas sp.]
MKVALLITKAEAGGAQSHVLELIDGIKGCHEVVFAVGDEGWLADQVRARGVSVTIIPDLVHPIRLAQDSRACRQIKQWLLREQPSLLHVHSSKAGLLGRIAARIIAVPSVFTAHGWAFTSGATMTRKLMTVPSEWLAARTGGDIICVSQYDRQLARRYAITSDTRLHVVWNGIGDTPERALLTSNPEPVITMVARFAAQKDHATLLRAIAMMGDVPCRLRLVGDGPLLSEAKALVFDLAIENQVEFMGSRTDVTTLLAHSDVFVLASHFEGLPISILEAMRAGLPVVASNVGGVSELVNEETGILVGQGDTAALAEALKRLLGNPALLSSMGAKGRERYEKDFRASTMIEKTLNVYETCLARNRRRK